MCIRDSIPPAFSDAPVSVQLPDGSWWTLTDWRGGVVQVWLHPGETLIVRILPDEQDSIAFRLTCASKPATRFTRLSPFISFSSAHISLSAGRLRLTLARSLGGLPIRMELIDGNKRQRFCLGANFTAIMAFSLNTTREGLGGLKVRGDW